MPDGGSTREKVRIWPEFYEAPAGLLPAGLPWRLLIVSILLVWLLV